MIKCGFCGSEDVVGFKMHKKRDSSFTSDMVTVWMFACKRCLNG